MISEKSSTVRCPPGCLATWGIVYFVVLGRTVDDFSEIIYSAMHPGCLATWGMACFVVLGRTRALVDDFGEIIDSAMPPRVLGNMGHCLLRCTGPHWSARR